MFAAYLRIVVMIVALIGAVALFAFAFTTAAIVVIILLLIGLILGRRPGAQVWVFRRTQENGGHRAPPVIDHDPNDLPPDRS